MGGMIDRRRRAGREYAAHQPCADGRDVHQIERPVAHLQPERRLRREGAGESSGRPLLAQHEALETPLVGAEGVRTIATRPVKVVREDIGPEHRKRCPGASEQRGAVRRITY